MNQLSPDTYNHRLTYEQLAQLLSPIYPGRVQKTEGYHNLEAYDVRAHLNRIFGFGNWDGEAVRIEFINERYSKNSKNVEAVSVVYRCQYTLRVRTVTGEDLATYTEWAVGGSNGIPLNKYDDAHDLAIKFAESQALKRCAINLGDQFGLGLYCKGNVNPRTHETGPIVNWTLAQRESPDDPVKKLANNFDADLTVTPETDPDGTPGDEDYAEPVGQGKPPAQEGEVTTYTEDQWWEMYTNSASRGPYVFADFIDWAYKNGAPEPVLNALEPQMNSLNQEAQQRNMEPAHVDFASLRAATARTR